MFATGGFTTTDLAGDKYWWTMPGERCFMVVRPDTSGQYDALKTTAMCFTSPVMSTTIRCGVTATMTKHYGAERFSDGHI